MVHIPVSLCLVNQPTATFDCVFPPGVAEDESIAQPQLRIINARHASSAMLIAQQVGPAHCELDPQHGKQGTRRCAVRSCTEIILLRSDHPCPSIQITTEANTYVVRHLGLTTECAPIQPPHESPSIPLS